MKSDIQLYPDLIKALEKNEIVYLFGAGFSTALSGRKYTWWDWIVDGIGRIKDHATADMLNESLMSDNSTDNMVSVVGKVIKILKEEGSYKTWMHLQLEKFDDALNVLKTMRSKCNYENINAVRILMLSHRNIIEMAFQMGKKDVIAKVMADAKMLSEKYLNDVDVQAKWMLCRLCDLEERFFDKGETISLDEVSEIKIEVPLNSYEKNNEASEYLGMLWGATNTFKLNFVNKDKDKINTIITDAREILSVNPYQCEVAGAFMSAQLALCKGILHRKIVRTEIDEVFRYVELNPYSESLRELFFNKLLPNSTEEKNRAHYLTKAVVINAQQDARYNPMSDGGVQEIADFEEGLREFLFGENKYQEPYKRVRPKVGANELCPCGSGKKFKKCCRGNGKYD